jgi:hypothetical protein
VSEPGTRELDRAAFATISGSFVPCPLKAGAQIAAGRCVEWQQENGCHCEHALPSLRRVEKHLTDEPARKAGPGDAMLAVVEERRLEQLDGVRTLIERAEQMEKARPVVVAKAPVPPPRPTLAQTYREAQRTRVQVIEKDIEERLAAKRTCTTPGCGTEFKSRKHDECWQCRVGMKKHLRPVAALAPEPRRRRRRRRRAAWRTTRAPPLQRPTTKSRRAYEEGGGSINKTMAKLGTTRLGAVKKRVVALGLTGKPPSPPPPTKPAARGEPAALLERQLAHHRSSSRPEQAAARTSRARRSWSTCVFGGRVILYPLDAGLPRVATVYAHEDAAT